RISEPLELDHHVDVPQGYPFGDSDPDRREVQNCFDAGADDPVDDVLGSLARNRDNRDLDLVFGEDPLELRIGQNGPTPPLPPDLGRVRIEYRFDPEAALLKVSI